MWEGAVTFVTALQNSQAKSNHFKCHREFCVGVKKLRADPILYPIADLFREAFILNKNEKNN